MSRISRILSAITLFSLVLAACTSAPMLMLPTLTPMPTSAPLPANTPTSAGAPRSNLVQPPPGLWRDAVPPDALDTVRSLESADIPQRDLIDLTTRLNDPGRSIPRVVRDEAWGFEIGDRHKFWVFNWGTREHFQVAARLVYKTPHTYVFVEEGVDLNQGQLKRLADRFERRTYPTNRKFFGEEWYPGVDNDPHLTILFARNLGYAGGYQTSVDEFSSLVHRYSNQMEMIYIGADGAQLDDDCLLAHEFEHVIQWAVDRNEETWLNEGFAELACQVNGLKSGYAEYILKAFARQPDTQLNSWSGDTSQALPQLGASYLFVAYFLDRFGEQTTRALAAHQADGVEGVDEVLKSLDAGIGFDDVFADWVVTNCVNDTSLAHGAYGYFSLDPPPFEAEVDYGARDVPVQRGTSVAQYAADYIVLRGEGSFQVDFAGATLVGLAPTSANSGQFVWWGRRGTDSDTTLTREFDLTGLQGATLAFYTWYDIEKDFDYAYVEVSSDGEHWTTLPGQTTTDYDPNGANYGIGYTGVSDGWIEEKIDLTPYVGQKVQIRFEYVTDDGPTHTGMFLDDIRIPELGYWDDAESVDHSWQARGFVRNTAVMPQKWLLRLVTQRVDRTTVERLQLRPDNTGRWQFDLGHGEWAILVVSGATRVTTERAEYWYAIKAVPEE